MDSLSSYLRKHIQVYDPGYLNIIYSLKAVLAVILSLLLHYFIFGVEALIWAGMTPMQVFFLHATLSQQSNSRAYMIGFALLSSAAVTLFTFCATKAFDNHSFHDIWWLALPVLVLCFCAGMSRAYSLDLYRMFVPVIVNSLVACIYVDSGTVLPLHEAAFVVLSGTSIGIIVGFLLLDTASNYGKYTRLYYPAVLLSLKNMVLHLHSPKDFSHYKKATFVMIYNIKQTLQTKSFVYNDNYLIKNIRRALFYIYRIEDICLMIAVLAKYNLHKNHPILQNEIVENLEKLSRTFIGKIPHISRVEADKIINGDASQLAKEQDKALADILKILYYKMESFCRVGSGADPTFSAPEKKGLKDVFAALSWTNVTFRFSVKYSLAIGLSLVLATLLNINRGIWVSLGVVSIVRPSVGGMQNLGIEYFVSAAIGILVGIVFSVFFTGTAFFIVFGITIFFVIYLRVYPFWLWSGFMMSAFVMMYSLLYEDFLHYAFDRLLDIGIGVLFAIMVFLLLWPRYSRDNLRPLLLTQTGLLKELFGLMADANSRKDLESENLQSKYTDFLHNLDELKETIKDSKHEVGGRKNQIVLYGLELVEVLEFIILRMNELVQVHTLRYANQMESESKNEGEVLYKNDLRALQQRFEMIEMLLNKTPHFFKFDEDNRFLSDEGSHSKQVIREIFGLQNRLYRLLSEDCMTARSRDF